MALTPIDSFAVDNPSNDARTVQLEWGDLPQMSPADAVDVLVVSCLPGDYTPSPGSLIGALANAGISVAQLAQNKAASWEPQMPCWLSQPISSTNPGIQFKRILVFEPPNPATSAAGLAWTIYQALACTYGTNPVRVAMPLVSTGSGGADPVAIVQALTWAAAHFGSSNSTRIASAKVVAYTQAVGGQVAPAFAAIRSGYQNVFDLKLPNNYASFASAAQSVISGRSIPPTVSRRQAIAVCIYTTNYYGTINNTLRNVPPTDPSYQAMMPLFEAIDSGLWNMTPHNGPTNRGETMSPDRINQYQVGAILMNVAYTSTSLLSGFGGNARITMNGRTGAEIWNYSQYANEQEVLFHRGLRFQVDTRSSSGGTWYFGVHELVTNWCGG